MKYLFVPVIMFTDILFSSRQVTIYNSDQFKYVNDPTLDYFFYISNKPITNLDYLTYLCWINDVFTDYPEILINAFPSHVKDTLKYLQQSDFNDYYCTLRKLITASYSENTNILFSQQYINYPVLGLSKKQINNFNKWLTDRYNEHFAIIKGVFQWDPYQIGPENFSTESYLHGQYEGLVNRNIKDKKTKQYRRIIWSDNFFIPTFRLPTDKELSIIGSKIEFKEYDSFAFLKDWSDYYIRFDKNGLMLKRGDEKEFFIEDFTPKNIDISVSAYTLSEYTCSIATDSNQLFLQKIYQDLGQEITDMSLFQNAIKDSIGHFPFQIISAKSNNPIYANPPLVDEYKYPAMFRVVINEYK